MHHASLIMAAKIFIIGGGQFGEPLAKELRRAGAEVTVADRNPARVQILQESGLSAIPLDATDEAAIARSAALTSDLVVISTGSSVQAGIYAALLLKHLKVRRVLACASDEKCARLLTHIGAEVVSPSPTAIRDLVKQLTNHATAPSRID
jgi:Trk K+ transport system NAD-binding subunit